MLTADQGSALDDSLAENDERVGLHPLDQFRAFQALRDSGEGRSEPPDLDGGEIVKTSPNLPSLRPRGRQIPG
jgi:hypothetical protein